MSKKIVICSGGFDPIHRGHVYYLQEAKKLGDKLLVGVNSDEWLQRKKEAWFMSFHDRVTIVNALRCVDGAMSFDDSDDSACDLIVHTAKIFPQAELIFANGGDRTSENIPEMRLQEEIGPRLKFAFGVGGAQKVQSSTTITDRWREIERRHIYNRVEKILSEHEIASADDENRLLLAINPDALK